MIKNLNSYLVSNFIAVRQRDCQYIINITPYMHICQSNLLKKKNINATYITSNQLAIHIIYKLKY